MRRAVSAALFALILAASQALGYVEAPHTLGFVVKDSTNIVLMQVAKVNKESVGLGADSQKHDLTTAYLRVFIQNNVSPKINDLGDHLVRRRGVKKAKALAGGVEKRAVGVGARRQILDF